ncbi:hypothetical protein GCM10011611_03160 [Aliidongia dinghuensis]|uniref:Uncharacterized protein n=1 Tax=Aliidongia dinghuensis TaxID=1867774 RepID=A0A8J3E2S3_9PROT|nr:hypothetical protein GCM10011611_03160 [Aliidongia dinghuensis]
MTTRKMIGKIVGSPSIRKPEGVVSTLSPQGGFGENVLASHATSFEIRRAERDVKRPDQFICSADNPEFGLSALDLRSQVFRHVPKGFGIGNQLLSLRLLPIPLACGAIEGSI